MSTKTKSRSDRLLTLADLRAEKGIHYTRSWLRQLALDGKFPKPVKLGEGKFARRQWLESEVDAWLAEKRRERDHHGEAA